VYCISSNAYYVTFCISGKNGAESPDLEHVEQLSQESRIFIVPCDIVLSVIVGSE